MTPIMKATILCSFGDIDLAEIAVSRLKQRIPGLNHIEISGPHYGKPDEAVDFVPMVGGLNDLMSSVAVSPSSFGALPVPPVQDEAEASSDYAPRSVTLRILCRAERVSDVEAQLINLGALNIRYSFDAVGQ